VTSELVVDVQPKEVSIALLEDKSLVELQSEGRNLSFSVGNMYLGRIKKLMPGLNACFVDVGYEKDAFLHYLDLGPQFNSLEKYVKQTLSDKKKLPQITKATILPDLEKDGTVANTLKVGQEVVVQIVKEPISTKGPRLTSEISFAGRYLVLIPFNDKVSVSQKIKSSEERARLKQLLMSIKPKNFGVIVRTVAEGKRVAELDGELKVLLKHWEDAVTKIQKATKFPTLIYEETSRAVGLLRDLFNPSFENIHVNDEAVFHEIKDYVTLIAPDRAGIVKLYKGQLPIYDNFGITKQIKSSFGKTVSYKSGAYLIIEHTEALHVVDVNSGNRTKNANGQEANALEVNLGAADELARQLRLRDMGGIIVVDFIDMNEAENRQKLYERMCANMQKDRARHNILPLSKFGLMQITRQRVRPAMDVNTTEICPTCFGKGTIKSSILFTDTLESKIDYLVNKLKIKKFSLHIHPYIAAYINQGLVSLKRKWQMKYGFGIKIIPSQKLAFLEYVFYDPPGGEIEMKEPIRYASGDPVEKWLYSFLCLDCASTPYRLMSGTPHPDKCELFVVNRDSLFSYHKLSEAFLQRVWSLYVSSHYKNSPDDLQLLSDAPAHMLFVLLGPMKEDQPLPDVYCVAQVCLEGCIGKDTVKRELSKGVRSAGDMIPWIVSQQFLDSDFSQLSGARIVRIATHPDVQGMGYGRRTLQLLHDYFQGHIQWSGEEEEVIEPEEEVEGLNIEAKPRKHLPPLLVSLADKKMDRLHV